MLFSIFVTSQNEPVSCLISVRKMMWILFSGRKYRNLTVWLDEKEVEVIYPRSKKSNLTGLRIDALLAMRQWIKKLYSNFSKKNSKTEPYYHEDNYKYFVVQILFLIWICTQKAKKIKSTFYLFSLKEIELRLLIKRTIHYRTSDHATVCPYFLFG